MVITQHLGVHLFELAPHFHLAELAVQQRRERLPDGLALAFLLAPFAKMRRQRLEVLSQPITGEHRHTGLGQYAGHSMHDPVCIRLSTSAHIPG
jgi:hypothetical protein